MNTNIPLKAVILCLLMMASLNLGAQSKSAIILINSIPYNVVLTNEGEITEIKGEAKGYMRGFIRSADEFEIPVDRSIATTADIGEGVTVRSERSMIDFERNYATLDEVAVRALDKVISGFGFTTGEKILITGFKAGENDSDRLATNRIATCRTYLELKGIPLSRIMTEVVASDALRDKISITYIK